MQNPPQKWAEKKNTPGQFYCQRVYGLYQCVGTGNSKTYNRDKNAARNILSNFLYARVNGDVPLAFQRTTPTIVLDPKYSYTRHLGGSTGPWLRRIIPAY